MPNECGVGNSDYTANLPTDRLSRMQSIVQSKSGAQAIVPVPVLATARLVLRPFCALDALPLWLLLADGRIARSALGQRGGVRPAQVGGEYNFAITLRYIGTLIGAVALQPDAHQDKLGYWLGVPWWGRGYASEASQAVTDWAFGALSLERLDATYLTHNAGSRRVLEKIGMRHVASFAHNPHEAAPEPYEHYALTREQWVAARA